MSQTLFEKLQLKDEKNLLIQGLPSSIEKQFIKLAFAKNVTPLLRMKKIDFALVFAINHNQLRSILTEVLPALQADAKLWVAYPKAASKIASDLNRDCSWNCLCDHGFEIAFSEPLDHVWTALRFKKGNCAEAAARAESAAATREPIPHELPAPIATVPKAGAKTATALAPKAAHSAAPAPRSADIQTAERPGKRAVNVPQDLEHVFTLHPKAKDFFDTLPYSHKREYIRWITDAKRDDTRKRRLDATLEKLRAGKKNPTEK